MLPYSTEELCAAVGGRLLQAGGVPVTGVIHDSRAVKDGDLYVALPGERVDGHRFVDSALEKGAVAVLIASEPGHLLPGKGYILVPDTERRCRPLPNGTGKSSISPSCRSPALPARPPPKRCLPPCWGAVSAPTRRKETSTVPSAHR